MDIQSALDQCKKEFVGKPGIIGVGKGKDADKECIVILLQDAQAAQDIPDQIENISIVKKEVGTINTQGEAHEKIP